jgi:thiol-disulfide isomerase/thioredoxin
MSLSLRLAAPLFALASVCGLLAAIAGCGRTDSAAETKSPPPANIARQSQATGPSQADSASKATPAASSNAEAGNQGEAKPASAISGNEPLPEDAKELLAHLQKLDAVRLEEDTREARAEFTQVQNSIVKGAEKLLANKELEETDRVEAVKLKWTASILLVNLGAEGAEDRFIKFANELVDDKNPQIGRTARLQLRQLDVMKTLRALLQGTTKNTDKLMQDVNLILSEEGLRYGQYEIIEQAARILEMLEKYDEASQVYAGMKKAFGASDDPELAAQVEHRAGKAATRLGWLGKEVKLDGTRLDGQPFNLDELKGKVVLVDFWATWCGPCIQELPNVLENYKKYHDRGFEVVGVSLDTDKDALSRFVGGENDTKEALQWVTLFSSAAGDSAAADPFASPLPEKFGVDGIPATFLVDKAGKLVSIGVRGERLGEKLAELLGTPDEVPEENADASGN